MVPLCAENVPFWQGHSRATVFTSSKSCQDREHGTPPAQPVRLWSTFEQLPLDKKC
jgi:hypothetical protein